MVLSGDPSHTLITSARLTLPAFKAADAAELFEEASAAIGTRQLRRGSLRLYGKDGFRR
jgi:hypothetical protein